MDEEEETIVATATLFTLLNESREYWVHPINDRRHQFGAFHILWSEIADDDERCKIYIRMTKKEFDVLYGFLESRLRKQNTNFREALPPEERLLVCLR